MNIRDTLENGPARIASASAEMEKARKALDLAKHNLTVAEASATIRHQTAKNSKLMEALVIFDGDVQAKSVAVIEAKGAYELTKIEHQRQDDLFISARKLAGMDEAEMRSLVPPHSQQTR